MHFVLLPVSQECCPGHNHCNKQLYQSIWKSRWSPPFLNDVRASSEPRPKQTKFKGAEEHADSVLSRNLARENPLFHVRMLRRKAFFDYQCRNRKGSIRLISTA